MPNDTNLPLDPALRHVKMDDSVPYYTLSIEPCGANREVYTHEYNLGTIEAEARALAVDIFEQVRRDHGCYTVALMYPHPDHSHRVIYDIWDGLGWESQHGLDVLELPGLVTPVVNLNGNTASDLIERLLVVKQHLVGAALSMGTASDVIHGRNFQTTRHPDAIRARAERAWVARIKTLNKLAEDIENLAIEIQRQGRQ